MSLGVLLLSPTDHVYTIRLYGISVWIWLKSPGGKFHPRYSSLTASSNSEVTKGRLTKLDIWKIHSQMGCFFSAPMQFYHVEYLQFNGQHNFWTCLQDIFGWKILAHPPFQQPKSLIHFPLASSDPSSRGRAAVSHSVSYEVFGSVTALSGRDRRSEKTSAAKAEDLSWFTMRRNGPRKRCWFLNYRTKRNTV